MVIVLALATGEAQAQYGPYGWGGWGGGSGTVQGNIARGVAAYDIGAGAYNEETAEAGAINSDTVMRWNEYMYLAQQEANRREYLRRQRRVNRDSQSGDAIYKRVRDNPGARDIQDGDALNAILDQLTNPKIHSTALRLIRTPITGKAIREIPFQNASEAVTLSLDQLSGEGVWPLALQGPAFAAERKAYQDAIDKAVKEDEEGNLSAQTLQEVNATLSRLRAKLEANKPADTKEYLAAVNHIKALVGMSRMLEKPQVDKILAELDSVKETTLGSLLGFMHTYNLRFAPATNDAQRTVYENLYPLMAEARDRVLKDVEAGSNDASPVARGNHRSATDFFQGMHLEHLQPRTTNDANKP